MIANGWTAKVLKLPNAMITKSRISDRAIADGGAVRAFVLKFTQPPNAIQRRFPEMIAIIDLVVGSLSTTLSDMRLADVG